MNHTSPGTNPGSTAGSRGGRLRAAAVAVLMAALASTTMATVATADAGPATGTTVQRQAATVTVRSTAGAPRRKGVLRTRVASPVRLKATIKLVGKSRTTVTARVRKGRIVLQARVPVGRYKVRVPARTVNGAAYRGQSSKRVVVIRKGRTTGLRLRYVRRAAAVVAPAPTSPTSPSSPTPTNPTPTNPTTPTDPNPVDPTKRDLDNDGYLALVDCDDADASIHPGASDPLADGVDQNCDGEDGIVVPATKVQRSDAVGDVVSKQSGTLTPAEQETLGKADIRRLTAQDKGTTIDMVFNMVNSSTGDAGFTPADYVVEIRTLDELLYRVSSLSTGEVQVTAADGSVVACEAARWLPGDHAFDFTYTVPQVCFGSLREARFLGRVENAVGADWTALTAPLTIS